MRNEKKLTIENAHIFYRNFSGKPSQYNTAGNRNFCVEIPNQELADILAAEGWTIKQRGGKEEGDEPMNYTQVKINFNGYKPPKVIMICGRNQQILTEETIDLLDSAEIENVDLIINPSEYEVRGAKGIKGYVDTMYVTIEQNVLDAKYSTMLNHGEE